MKTGWRLAKGLFAIDSPTFQERPLLCYKEPTFKFGKIETIADAVAAEIDAVDSFRQFSRETYVHCHDYPCNPKSQDAARAKSGGGAARRLQATSGQLLRKKMSALHERMLPTVCSLRAHVDTRMTYVECSLVDAVRLLLVEGTAREVLSTSLRLF